MMTYVHLWYYLADFFSEWRKFVTNVEKYGKYILCTMSFLQKLCHLWDNVDKYGWARQIDDSVNTRQKRCDLPAG